MGHNSSELKGHNSIHSVQIHVITSLIDHISIDKIKMLKQVERKMVGKIIFTLKKEAKNPSSTFSLS